MKTLFSLAFTLLFSALLMAQEVMTVPLEDGDLDRFIKTYKPLTADLEDLGQKFDETKDYSMMQTLAANSEVKAVFDKHGWNDQWMGKWMTISIAYGIAKLDEELTKMPEDQRIKYEQYMAASSTQLRAMVTDKDVELVKERISELDQILDN